MMGPRAPPGGTRLRGAAACALEEVQVEHFVARRGEDAQHVRKVKFKLHDKQSALDMLARHLGMYPMSERRGRRPKLSAR
jgi:hypothetical protein